MAVAMLVVSLGIAAGKAISQSSLAQEQQKIQDNQIRSQSVQLRIQDMQQDIAEQNKLRQINATAMVQLGSRNISSASGSVRAIFNQNFEAYDEDKDARRLNLEAKETALDISKANVEMQERSQQMNIWTNFGESAASSYMGFKGQQLPSGRQARLPAPSSTNTNFNPNA